MGFKNLSEFYRSDEWENFRTLVIEERTREDGFLYDEVTNKPIVRPYDVILHHIKELTEENVHDFNVSLNPLNIQIVSHKTHNLIHGNFTDHIRQVFLVYGSPCSGKTSYVQEVRNEGDLIVDMDKIYAAISGCELFNKPNRLKAVAFTVRDTLLDCVKYRKGQWKNAYVIGGYPLAAERQRMLKDLNAREIFVSASETECLSRLEHSEDRDKKEWRIYIRNWFENYSPG